MIVKSCKHCRKIFETKRKDKVYCSNECKVKQWHIDNDYYFYKELVPEKEIQDEYYTIEGINCLLFLKWFKSNGKRFADVYIRKHLTKEVEQKIFNQNKIRVVFAPMKIE